MRVVKSTVETFPAKKDCLLATQAGWDKRIKAFIYSECIFY
jgi:hypothetical protein